jgi:RNA polymerase sigma-70 factor, ECF subfamily
MGSDLTIPAESDASAERLGGLLRDHYAFTWRCVRRFGVAERDVDDVVQEVFVVVSAKLARIEPGKERAFVTGTAIKLAANRRRSQRRAPELRELDTDSDCETACPLPSAEELIEQKRRRILLDRALDVLPLELRAPFVLSEIEGLSRSETAELLGLPEGTVATRVRAARKRFEAAAKQLMRTGSLSSTPSGGAPGREPDPQENESVLAPDREAGEVSGTSALLPSGVASSGVALGGECAVSGENRRLEGARISRVVVGVGDGTAWGDEGLLTSRCVGG